MKTHKVIDLYAWLNEEDENVYVGTYEECLNFVGSRDTFHKNHEIIELTESEKTFYQSITFVTL